MQPSKKLERYLPLGYFVAAILLVILVLPTILRQRPPQPNETAELSPDTPPNDQESLVANFSRGSSATAGAGTAVGVGDGPGVGIGPGGAGGGGAGGGAGAVPKACPFGFGVPPRQTFSVYAAPCATAWRGDNGGATFKGVSNNEIRVAVGNPYNDVGTAGPVALEPNPNQNAADRTWTILQKWFNSHYQFYGRQLRFYVVKSGLDETAQRGAVTQADESFHTFATVTVGGEYGVDESARRKMVAFGDFVDIYPTSWLSARAPYAYVIKMELDRMFANLAEYTCKQLWNKPAAFAGDPVLQLNKRKLGLVYLETTGGNSAYGDSSAVLGKYLRDDCGANLTTSVALKSGTVLSGTDAQALSTTIARMKADGVTTVIPAIEWVTAIPLTHTSSSQDYFPEWLSPGFGQPETNGGARLMAQEQWAHAFGLNSGEMTVHAGRVEGNRAYWDLDPNNDPNNNIIYDSFYALEQLANGIQLAGPRLTPQTFQQGLYALGHRPPNPIWSMGGGFGTNDYSYSDYVGETWWDPLATDDNGDQGAYRWTDGGRRYALGQWPTRDPLVFHDGIAKPPEDN